MKTSAIPAVGTDVSYRNQFICLSDFVHSDGMSSLLTRYREKQCTKRTISVLAIRCNYFPSCFIYVHFFEICEC